MAHQARRDTTKKVLTGVGLATLAAAAAGAAFLYGTEAGKKKRKEIKSWSLRMQADVMDKMAQMKDWSEEAYNQTVNAVAEKYKNAKNIDTAEVAALVSTLRNHWKNIKRQVEGGKRSAPRRKAAGKSKGKKTNSKKK